VEKIGNVVCSYCGEPGQVYVIEGHEQDLCEACHECCTDC